MSSTISHSGLCIGSELLLALGILVADGRALAETFVWHSVPSGVTATLTSVAWANDRFLAVGAGGTILSSTNGLVWKSEVSGLGVTFEAAGFAGGKYYVVGGQGTILASVDAATWLPQSSGTELFITGVAAGAGTVVLAGDDGTILVPPAYLGSWRSVNDSVTVNYDLYDITHGANGFVTVGQFGRVLISASGTHWLHVDEVVSTYLFGVTFAAGNYVAVGESGTVTRSGNGIDWAPMNSGTTEELRAVAFGSDRFVASGANGMLLTSIDGSSWSPETSGVASTLYGVAYGNDRFVVVGSGGTILTGVLRLPTVLSAHFGRNPAELELSIASTPGETVSLEHATQLTNWSAVAVFTNHTGNLTTLRPWIAGMESEVFRAYTP